jgi:hypothetical protein
VLDIVGRVIDAMRRRETLLPNAEETTVDTTTDEVKRREATESA